MSKVISNPIYHAELALELDCIYSRVSHRAGYHTGGKKMNSCRMHVVCLEDGRVQMQGLLGAFHGLVCERWSSQVQAHPERRADTKLPKAAMRKEVQTLHPVTGIIDVANKSSLKCMKVM